MPTLTQGTVHLDARRLDSPGTYAVNGTLTPRDIQASITANEPARGLLATIGHVPDVGPLALQASVNGPRDAIATQLGLTAGPLKASASGTIDLDHEAADLAVRAEAPAMTSGAGDFLAVDPGGRQAARPVRQGRCRRHGADRRAGGRRCAHRLAGGGREGQCGQVDLHASLADLRLPGPKPDIFAAAPIVIDASARLDAADRPVTFELRHPLVSAEGTAQTAGVETLKAHLALPDLAPLAAAGGTDIRGSTDLDVQAEVNGDTTTASAKGRLSVTGGMAPVPALIGDDCRIDVAGSMHGQDMALSHLTVDGKALDVSAQGGLADKQLDVNWTVALADLAALQPSLSGRVDAKGHAGGAMDALAVQADIGADVGGQRDSARASRCACRCDRDYRDRRMRTSRRMAPCWMRRCRWL